MESDTEPPLSPRSHGLADPFTTSTDPPATTAVLAPSPHFREAPRAGKDDYATPMTPKVRSALGLSLQMPRTTLAQDMASPLSAQADAISASPITSLPRHSRGLDYSRASTNLHHSTLAEQRSPDLSPIITQKGMAIPSRKMSTSSMVLDSPNIGGTWSALTQGRSAVSSSVGSVNMLVSDSESTSSEDDGSIDDDPILSTPHVHKLNTPFRAHMEGSVFGDAGAQSPVAGSLLRTIRKSRLTKSTRKMKGSSSGHSSIASPRAGSPPPTKSIEGYFGLPKSRRESLAMGTDLLHLSSGNDSGDEVVGVIRRPVTRRGNLLPKTKGFARIRATLAEEASPIDTDTRREAETIRQVRDRDNVPHADQLTPLSPTIPALPSDRELDAEARPTSKGLGVNFQLHLNRRVAESTPPPSFSRHSSTMTSDIFMVSPSLAPHDAFSRVRDRAHSTASDISEAIPQLSSAASCMNDDMHIKKLKRRREDDFDGSMMKRRAVSPGMSSQNSPVLAQSPQTKDGTWGFPPEKKPNTASSDISMSSLIPARTGSAGSSSTSAVGGKKLGQKGMADTNDGIMKMSIE